MKAIPPQIIPRPKSPPRSTFIEEEKAPIVLAPDVKLAPSQPVESAGVSEKDFLIKFKALKNDLT